MDKSELDILLRQIRLEERIIGDKENRNMDGSTVSFQSLRLSGQPSNLLMISPHGRFRPTPMHTHDYLEVMYLYDGSITQHGKGGSAVLSHGDFFFIPPGIYHATDICGAGDIAVNLIVSDELLKKEAFSILRENLPPNEPYLIQTGHRRANETVCRLMEPRRQSNRRLYFWRSTLRGSVSSQTNEIRRRRNFPSRIFSIGSFGISKADIKR